MYECYDNIVGLSGSDCECTAQGRPEDYNESQSGLFIDDLTPIAGLLNTPECGKTMWQILQRERNSAISTFVKDTNALMLKGKNFKLKRPEAKNQVIGQIKATKNLSTSKNYGVVRIVCCPIRSGFMKINGIGTLFNLTDEVEVSLYSNVDGLIDSFTLDTEANVHKTNTITELILPVYSKYIQPLEYYLVYEFGASPTPKANEINCGCGGWKPHFNTGVPYYNDKGHKALWANYIMIAGGQIDSLDQLNNIEEVTGVSWSNKMMGLTLDLSFGCKLDEVICKDALDFSGNPLALSVAYAILYRTGYNIADFVIKNPALTKENMTSIEQWKSYAKQYLQEYNEHANYIAEEVNITANDCLTCEGIVEMTRQGLFA